MPAPEGQADKHSAPVTPSIRVGRRRIDLPANRLVRVVLGAALIAGGLLGFLPFLGFWMVPLGILVLSIDFALMRRWRRKASVALANGLGRKQEKS
jgi:purine-cytosine permease-like protein